MMAESMSWRPIRTPTCRMAKDFAESAEAVGVSYEQLLQRILNLGLNYRPHWYG